MAVRPDYRFCWKPKWILSHLFVLSCVVAFILLGFWQLRRLDERKAHNAVVRAAEVAPPTGLTNLHPASSRDPGGETTSIEYRSTTLTGTYVVDQQVLVQNRTQNGEPGYWVITPMRLDDGTMVAVNRGWVPFGSTSHDGPWPEFDPPAGRVTVAGLVRLGETRGSGLIPGPQDPSEGHLAVLARVDLDRIAQQVDSPLLEVYVDLVTQDPPQPSELPVPVPTPDLDEGPHLDYASQWFAFALLTCIVYPLLLRRTAHRAAGEGSPPADPSEEPGSDPPSGPDRSDPAPAWSGRPASSGG